MTAPWRNPNLTVTTHVTEAGDYRARMKLDRPGPESLVREQIAKDIELAVGECDANPPCPVCEAMLLSARIARGTAHVIARGIIEDPR